MSIDTVVAISGGVSSLIALIIAALALRDTRMFRASDKQEEEHNMRHNIRERVGIIEEKLAAHGKEIKSTQEDIRDVRDGFYKEVREIKEDIRMILKIIIKQ